MEKRILIVDDPELLTPENVAGYAVKNYMCSFMEVVYNEVN